MALPAFARLPTLALLHGPTPRPPPSGLAAVLLAAGPAWLSLALLNNECHEYVVVLIDLAD